MVDLKTEYYDLGLVHRDETGDQVTIDSANATKKYGVAVKCATITPNAKRMTEYNLHQMWKSPNGTIRSMLDGTVFRTPITIPSISPAVKFWKKPITIARHAYGDVYKSVDIRVEEPGVAKLVFEGESGKKEEQIVHTFKGPGVLQGMHNTDASIRSFAHACFKYALDLKQSIWFATKDTIAKKYDGRFREIFEEVFAEYKDAFEAAGIEYFYTLIDDAVARVMRSEGGFIWACKNYDGDVMSDMVSTAFGSLAMMTSVLVSPDGKYEYEAAHGTVTRHYYKYLKGEKTSTNPMATIFAWSGAFKKRGELDGLPELVKFGEALEAASLQTLNDGIMTNMAVVNGSGLVGRVYEVGYNYAKVLSIIDPRSSVATLVGRTRDNGMLQGETQSNSDSAECYMYYLPNIGNVKIGDSIYTSGLDSRFPKGLYVGTVTAISRSQETADKYVVVSPAVQFSSIEEVFVLREQVETAGESLPAVPTATPKPIVTIKPTATSNIYSYETPRAVDDNAIWVMPTATPSVTAVPETTKAPGSDKPIPEASWLEN